MDPNDKEIIDRDFRNISFIWIGMICSLGVYILIAILMQARAELHQSDLNHELYRNIFFFVAAAQFMISFVLRRVMIQVRVRSGGMEAPHNGTPLMPTQVMAKYKSTVIITCALSEGIIVYGFILLFLFKDIQNFYIFTAVSALALIMHRPKREEFKRLTW